MMDCVRKNDWFPLKMGRNGTMVSHLMFTDDILLIYEAYLDNLGMVNGDGCFGRVW